MAVENGLDRGCVFQNDPVDLAVVGVTAQGVARGGLSDLFGQRPQFQQADDQMQRIAVRVPRTIRIADRYVGIERRQVSHGGVALFGTCHHEPVELLVEEGGEQSGVVLDIAGVQRQDGMAVGNGGSVYLDLTCPDPVVERVGFEEKGQLLCGLHLVDRVVDGLNRQGWRGGLQRCGRHRGQDHRKHGNLPYSRRE